MFDPAVEQNRQAYLALGLGAILTLLVVLSYAAGWTHTRSRPHENANAEPAIDHEIMPVEHIPTRRAIPWVLIVVYAGIAVFAIIYFLHSMHNPPNW